MNTEDSGRDAAAARGVKAGKKAKADKPGKGEKGEVLGEVRRLAEDLAALRAELARLRGDGDAADASDGRPAPRRGGERASERDGGAQQAHPAAAGRAARALEEELGALVAATGMAAVAVGYALPPAAGADAGDGQAAVALGADLLEGAAPEAREAREARAARLAFALSSPQKIALARLLLLDGPQGAAQLGAGAGLTTGSLYHHLRDMQHAGVIAPAGRSRFRLTPLGSHAVLTLLALAEEHRPAD